MLGVNVGYAFIKGPNMFFLVGAEKEKAKQEKQKKQKAVKRFGAQNLAFRFTGLPSASLWRLSPNLVTFSAAISSCEKGRRWTKATELLAELRASGVQERVGSGPGGLRDTPSLFICFFKAGGCVCVCVYKPSSLFFWVMCVCVCVSFFVEGTRFRAGMGNQVLLRIPIVIGWVCAQLNLQAEMGAKYPRCVVVDLAPLA